MKAILITLLASTIIFVNVKAQTTGATSPKIEAYGKVSSADMEMKSCDFEKDANAMVLFDRGDVFYQGEKFNVFRHKRVKIFNDNGKKEANVRIEFIGIFKYQTVQNLQAQTINLVNGKQVITKLDSKSVFIENVDKQRSAYVFAFPNVQPGSIIEFKYLWSTNGGIPPWSFQSKIPTRYSVLTTELPNEVTLQIRGGAAAIDIESTKGVSGLAGGSPFDLQRRSMTNVVSLVDEPYMTSLVDNLHSVYFRYKRIGGDDIGKLWDKQCQELIDDEDFGSQLNRKLSGEEEILAKVKSIPTEKDKIVYLFNQVRNAMKWNDVDDWYTNDGTVKAWEKKAGNSTEINIILYHLLKKAGIDANLMLVSTRDNGKVFGAYPTLNQFNRTVVAIREPFNYILDASGKFNTYNEIPESLLNNYALRVNIATKQAYIVSLARAEPTRQMAVVTAEIKADGKMTGTAELDNSAYGRIDHIKKFKTDGEQKYLDYLRGNDNNLKISDLKIDNMDVDTLPLVQTMAFKTNLTADGGYLFFSPAMFTPMRSNPFLSENRVSDIEFGYRDNFSMVGMFKIPEGYKADVLPKNITVQMPDQSITVKRVIGEQDGTVVARFVIDYKKSTYLKDDYEQLFDFYKKLNELMNEQVALKKM